MAIWIRSESSFVWGETQAIDRVVWKGVAERKAEIVNIIHYLKVQINSKAYYFIHACIFLLLQHYDECKQVLG